MNKEIINTQLAPAPIGPYSQAVKANGMIYISGQIAIDAENSELDTSNIYLETNRVMKNLEAILFEANLTFKDVVKTTILLSSMDLFVRVNEIYASYFNSDFPARETYAVKGLPRGVNVEISMIALCV
jgi:2-iminobutanoate/2-iminopropanoate deaminase